MADNRDLVVLTPEEKQELERWAQSRTLPAGDVFRARLILALAAGRSYREIEKSLGTSAPTLARWRKRFEQRRLDGPGGTSPRESTTCGYCHGASASGATGATDRRWQYALVLSKVGERAGVEQIHGTAHPGASAAETASPGTLCGQQTCRVRKQSSWSYGLPRFNAT
jgi:Helix-turn-helix domain